MEGRKTAGLALGRLSPIVTKMIREAFLLMETLKKCLPGPFQLAHREVRLAAVSMCERLGA